MESFLELKDVDVVCGCEGTIPNQFGKCLKFRGDFDKTVEVNCNSTITLVYKHFGFVIKLGVNIWTEEFTKDFGFKFGSNLLGFSSRLM